MPPDVEAPLFDRMHEASEYYLAPMGKCHQLVGVIRARWHALSERHGGVAAAERRVL